MKNVFFAIIVLFCISCSADKVEFPSTYLYDSTTLIDYFIFESQNGAFVEVDKGDHPEPSLALIANSASVRSLEFVDDERVIITDGFGSEEVRYSGNSARIFMDKDGQAIEFDGSVNGEDFSIWSIASGDFDGVSQNIYISALCGDVVNCNDINPSDWVLPNGAGDGSLQYVVIRSDVLKKQ